MDIRCLETRYINSCKKHRVMPNNAVISWFQKVKNKRSIYGKCGMVISLDQLKDADIFPLKDVFLETSSSQINRVDIIRKSPCPLHEENLLSLIYAIGAKLNVVDLQGPSFGENFLQNLCEKGMSCQVLNLWSTQIQKLHMVGSFTRLHTLNLDFCTSITSFHQDCFSGMPNLVSLSLCETRITNLWTTTAVLSKLQSLTELRFQKCLCCHDTGACPLLLGENANAILFDDTGTSKLSVSNRRTSSSLANAEPTIPNHVKKISSDHVHFGAKHPSSLDTEIKEEEDELTDFMGKLDLKDGTIPWKNYFSEHPSPICYEKHYREYLIFSLSQLKVLDNRPILELEKRMVKTIISSYYEFLPYRRQHKESVASVLMEREKGSSSFHRPKSSRLNKASQCSFTRSLIASKFGSSTWPLVQPLSEFSHLIKEEGRRLYPRQFEYHPTQAGLMVFGTMDGEIVVINHEDGKLIGYVPFIGEENSILGLCWIKKHPSKLIAGSDDGSLKLFDVNHMQPKASDLSCFYNAVTFDNFEQLTSVHVNSTDDWFLASGYSRNIALYDIASGKRMELFTNMHRDPINVAKFAHHSPFMFATSSFDRNVKMWDLREKPVRPCYTVSSSSGNVMVCFSSDDRYLLVSAVDNEVKQLLAVDGRLHMNFEIAPSGNSHNYTRSYYMNGRDYIISGSSEEHTVRICCAQTGRRLKDVYLEDGDSGNPLCVQSLRGDPFRDFHMSVLAASRQPKKKNEILKINLLESSYPITASSHKQNYHPSYSLGG